MVDLDQIIFPNGEVLSSTRNETALSLRVSREYDDAGLFRSITMENE